MTTYESDDEKLARLEMISAIPGMVKLGTMVAAVVEDALADARNGRRMQSCLHAVDEANTGNPGGGMLPIGWRRETSRTAFLCVRHPRRLLCDKPAGRVGPGCVAHHFVTEHRDEAAVARCFTCEQPIPEEGVTPVFAVVALRQPLTVSSSYDREFQYRGELHTLPITYLCPRHARQVNLPIPITWPRR